MPTLVYFVGGKEPVLIREGYEDVKSALSNQDFPQFIHGTTDTPVSLNRAAIAYIEAFAETVY